MCCRAEALPPVDVNRHIEAAVANGADRGELEESVHALGITSLKGLINLVRRACQGLSGRKALKRMGVVKGSIDLVARLCRGGWCTSHRERLSFLIRRLQPSCA